MKTPIPSSWIGDRDRFPAWVKINQESEPEGEGERWLLRNGRGGLVWIHIDENDMAYKYSLIGDDVARVLWPRLILQFRETEESALKEALQPKADLERAIETALGGVAMYQGIWLDNQDANDGTIMRQMVVHLRGIVRAWVGADGRLVRSELVTGEEAWAVV